MSYVKLSTTVSNADTVMNNFYHVAQGNLLPYSGTSFATATIVGCIGSASASWRTLHCMASAAYNSLTNNSQFKTLQSSYSSAATVTSILFNITESASVPRFFELYIEGEPGTYTSFDVVVNGLSGTNYTIGIMSIYGGYDRSIDMDEMSPYTYYYNLASCRLIGTITGVTIYTHTALWIKFSVISAAQKMVSAHWLYANNKSIQEFGISNGFVKDESTKLQSIQINWTAKNVFAELWRC